MMKVYSKTLRSLKKILILAVLGVLAFVLVSDVELRVISQQFEKYTEKTKSMMIKNREFR